MPSKVKCRCGRTAVIFRKHEGRALCEQHFCYSVERKVRKTIRENGMVKKGDRIIVGISGGKDSAVLLYLLHRVFSKRPDIKLTAVTIDEGIKGYREECIEAASRLCKNLGLEHRIYTFKERFGKTLDHEVKKLLKKKGGLREPCTYCGVGRRYLLNRAAKELKATKLAMGHNLDDEVQSVMMNYIRGDLFRASRMGAVTNLSMAKKRGKMFIPRIRPLRLVPEREVALYGMLRGLPMALNECPYVSGVRFDVRDFINDMEDKYSGTKFNILETFEKILPGIRKLAARQGEIKICKKCGEPGSEEVCKTCKLWRT